MTKVSSAYIPRCNFCGARETDNSIKTLISGLDACICDKCILHSLEILEENTVFEDLPKPKEIKNFLDKYVISQDYAKKVLAVAVYNHFKRLQKISRVELQKSNILLVGNTGSGKAQPLYSKIKTPNGWIKMGDIKIGQEVCTPDGKTAFVTGIFPQGVRPTYRVILEDGRSTDCDEDHLWKIYSDKWNIWKVLPLKKIIELQKSLDLYIPVVDSKILDTFKRENFDFKYKIKSIEYLGTQEAQCIMIDHPDHLYITDNNIVTHNTLLAQTLAKVLNVPFAIVDATSMTEAGYVGEDVETILQTLLINCDFDVEKAQRGIVYVDELDKKARKTGANVSISRDVSGEGVQRALLKMIEGTIVNVHPDGSRKHPGQQYIRVDTSNILFIFGGAFDGLVDIIARRKGRNNVGFLAEKTRLKKEERSSKLLRDVTHKDLISYGLIPELTGRIPVIVSLEELDIDDLCKVLVEPKNALVKQYEEFLNMDGVKLIFEPGALRAIAEKTKKTGTGARGLRSVMEELMTDIMYEIPSKENVKECIVTKECVEKNIKPRLIIGSLNNVKM